MKKLIIAFAFIVTPFVGFAQGFFDSFENEKDVTSVVVTQNMFKLLAEIDIESDDPEVKEYMELVNNLENIKIYMTDNPEVRERMKSSVSTYLSQNSGLAELMRVSEEGKNIKFYSKEGKSKSHVSELLMFLQGDYDGGKDGAIIMSITGNIDLKQISKLTKDLNVPGSEELKNIENKG